MKKITPILLIISLIVIGLSVSACTKTVDTAETADEAPTLEVPPFPLTPTEEGSSLREIVSMTQTASALQTTEAEPPVATPTVEEAAPEEGAGTEGEETEEAETTEGEEAAEAEETEGEETEAEETETEETEAEETTVEPGERPETYTLKEGEWIICIARRYDLDLNEFFRINGLSMSSVSYEGLELKIPAEGNWQADDYGPRALKEHPADHTVTGAQTIYTVACNYGDVMPMDIITLNNLEEPYAIAAGDILKIP